MVERHYSVKLNSLDSFVVTELANTMKYGGEGFHRVPIQNGFR